MQPLLDIEKIKATLAASGIVTVWRITVADETAERAVYKLRCHLLRAAYQLEIRLIHTGEALIYSYQLFSDQPLLRWDNAPHFPSVSSFPHHFHSESGQIETSSLTGDPSQDLPMVLHQVEAFLTSLTS